MGGRAAVQVLCVRSCRGGGSVCCAAGRWCAEFCVLAGETGDSEGKGHRADTWVPQRSQGSGSRAGGAEEGCQGDHPQRRTDGQTGQGGKSDEKLGTGGDRKHWICFG